LDDLIFTGYDIRLGECFSHHFFSIFGIHFCFLSLIGMAEFIKYLKSDFFNVLMKQLFF
jgi:hypothetical protein